MDIAKILNFGCAVILIVCLIFSAVSASKLQSALRENEALAERAESLLATPEKSPDVPPADTEDQSPSLPTGTPNDTITKPAYCIRAVNNRIGIYTADGLPVRTVEIDPTNLPMSDREALANGILMDSWEAVLSYISDYTS